MPFGFNAIAAAVSDIPTTMETWDLTGVNESSDKFLTLGLACLGLFLLSSYFLFRLFFRPSGACAAADIETGHYVTDTPKSGHETDEETEEETDQETEEETDQETDEETDDDEGANTEPESLDDIDLMIVLWRGGLCYSHATDSHQQKCLSICVLCGWPDGVWDRKRDPQPVFCKRTRSHCVCSCIHLRAYLPSASLGNA